MYDCCVNKEIVKLSDNVFKLRHNDFYYLNKLIENLNQPDYKYYIVLTILDDSYNFIVMKNYMKAKIDIACNLSVKEVCECVGEITY